MSKLIRVMLVDDHAVLRSGLELMLNSQPDLEVVARAEGVQEALQLVTTAEADVIVMDLSLPDGNGMTATEQVLRLYPSARIIGLSRHNDRVYVQRMREAGAAGYVLKQAVAENLLRAIRTVAAGGTAFDPPLVEDAAHSDSHAPLSHPVLPAPTGEALTAGEELVLRRAAGGEAPSAIATTLKLSAEEIVRLKASAMQKLRLHSHIDLLHYADAQGWHRNV